MADKNPSDSRRRLLKSVAAGSGTFIIGYRLPEEWIKPVVDSVALPAHAQTTGNPQMPGEDCGPLCIPGNTLKCSHTSTLYHAYWLDDTGNDPVLVDSYLPAPAEILRFGFNIDIFDSEEWHDVQALVQFGPRIERRLVYIAQNCNHPDPDIELPIDMVFTALSGAQWRATGKLSRTVSSVSISDTLVKPI